MTDNKSIVKPVIMEGIFRANAKGFGFVSADDLDEDLFVPEGETGTALDGDEVEVEVKPASSASRGHREAEVIRVTARNTTTIVGTFYGKKKAGNVIPDNRKIPSDVRIVPGKTMGAVNGHKVVVRITDYGDGGTAGASFAGGKRSSFGEHIPVHLAGEIVEILGHMDDPGVDILSIIRAYNLPKDFPDDVKEEVKTRIPEEISLTGVKLLPEKSAGPEESDAERHSKKNTDSSNGKERGSDEEIHNASSREDWRDVPIVTIDGPDTKDIDDAISIRRLSAGKDRKAPVWELGVHIADVSEYVRENSPLDREAAKRATSNYLVDRVIPMLPHELSNGICSLNPGEDRFALSCVMELDRGGRIVNSRIAETVIRSNAKLSYPGVMKLFEEGDETEIRCQLEAQAEGKPYDEIVRKYGNPDSGRVPRYTKGVVPKAHELAAMLRLGRRLSKLISKRRMADGAIDFEFPECKILLDTQGNVTDIVPYVRNEATMMIENFMVAANETVAKTFYWLGVPFVYRTHGVPDEEKMESLREFVGHYGYTFRWKRGEVQPKELQTMLSKVAGKPEEATIAVMTLRSMQRAMYTTECGGHFGLALRYYCHFTSPIRRYPDLQIHRIIKEYLRGKLNAKRRAHYESILPAVCRQSSDMERRADEAERETDKQKMCEYMKNFLGDVFEGTISGVTGWGFYVQLPNTVEGLVPVRALRDDYYEFDEGTAQLIGQRTGKHYSLGQAVKVSVASVDTAARTIDFELLTDKKAEKLSAKSGKPSEENSGKRRRRHGKKKKKLTQGGLWQKKR